MAALCMAKHTIQKAFSTPKLLLRQHWMVFVILIQDNA
jgi:hypothetical protein